MTEQEKYREVKNNIIIKLDCWAEIDVKTFRCLLNELEALNLAEGRRLEREKYLKEIKDGYDLGCLRTLEEVEKKVKEIDDNATCMECTDTSKILSIITSMKEPKGKESAK